MELDVLEIMEGQVVMTHGVGLVAILGEEMAAAAAEETGDVDLQGPQEEADLQGLQEEEDHEEMDMVDQAHHQPQLQRPLAG